MNLWKGTHIVYDKVPFLGRSNCITYENPSKKQILGCITVRVHTIFSG